MFFRRTTKFNFIVALLWLVGITSTSTVEAVVYADVYNTVFNSNSTRACTNCHKSTLAVGARWSAPEFADFDIYSEAASRASLSASYAASDPTVGGTAAGATAPPTNESMPLDDTSTTSDLYPLDAKDLNTTEKALLINWRDQGAPYAAPSASTNAGTRTNTTITLNSTINTNVYSGTTVPGSFYYQYEVDSGQSYSEDATDVYDTTTSPVPRVGTTSITTTNTDLQITGLLCGTAYNFRAVATNGSGTTYGTHRTVSTLACSAPVIYVDGGANNGPINLNLSKGQSLTNVELKITATDVDYTNTLDWSISSPANTGGITTPAIAGVASTSSANTANPVITYTAPVTVPVDPVVSFTVQVEDETTPTTLKDTIVINVTIVDNAPTIDEGATLDFPVAEDSTNNVLQLNATDVDGDPLTWTTPIPPAGNYTGVVNAGDDTKFDITYSPVPQADTLDADTFTVRVSDGIGSFDIEVSVDISGSPDDPVANDDPNLEVLVNSSNNVLDVLSNDTDVDTGDTKTLAAQVIVGSNGGTITVNNPGTANNTLTYTPVTDAVVAESFSYTVTDSDGLTDTALATVSPPDTDADGVFDYIDNCAATPNGPLLGADNQADNDGDQVINVNTTSDPADPLVGGDACDTDDDNDGMLDADEILYPGCLDPFNAADATEDCDGDGINNITEVNDGDPNTDPNLDSVGPTVIAPADITMNATGIFTVVDLGTPSGSDGNDGTSTIFKAAVNLTQAELDILDTPPNGVPPTGCQALSDYETDIGPFRSGRYVITWATCDSAGNPGRDSQTVNIKPLVSVSAGQSIGEGQTATIDVVLNGDAIAYPATVQYSVGGTATSVDDHDAVAGTVTFSVPGDVGVISFDTVADAIPEADESVIVTLFSPTNIALSSRVNHTVTITESNIAPRASLSVTQPAAAAFQVVKGSTVFQADGVVSVIADAFDANGDTLSFDWSATDAGLLAHVGTTVTANQLDFDPAAFTAGDFYKVSVTVSESGGANPVVLERLLLVEDVGDSTDYVPTDDYVLTDDFDGDGEDNIVEGHGDADGDGIPNYRDHASTPANAIEIHTVDLDHNVYIETDSGLKIAKGETAIAARATGLIIGLSDIADFGGAGGLPVTNSATDYTFISGLFNFEVSGLTDADTSVNVVIPLSSAIQDGAVYRKYTASGWFDFVEDDANSVRSAKGSDGICPPAGSFLYTAGLTTGDTCLQLTIQDGGANDADGVRNYIVKDPGGLALAPEVEEVAVQADADGRIGSTGLWFMIMLFLVSLLFWQLRQTTIVKLKSD